MLVRSMSKTVKNQYFSVKLLVLTGFAPKKPFFNKRSYELELWLKEQVGRSTNPELKQEIF